MQGSVMAVRYSNPARTAFTLIDLMVALCVVSIVMAAVASLAYAMGTANDASDDASTKQAQLRCATLRIGEMIRNCRLIISNADNNLAIWKADYNNDGQINLGEVAYIGSAADKTYIRVYEFTSDDRTLNPGQVGSLNTGWWYAYDSTYYYTYLIPVCSNVSITTDVAPPWSKTATISFKLVENRVTKTYQIVASLRAPATHMLDATGYYLYAGDDELHPTGGYPIFGNPVAF
jgi:Tfp pilus assembly protein PilW